MGCTVYANSMSIACKAADGKTVAAMPDVCLSPPSPPAGPIPLPYPNTAMASDTTDGSTTVQISGQEVMLKNQSSFKKSSGDEAATKSFGMNVVTHQIQGSVAFIAWSMDVKFEGANVPRNLDLTGHNEASDPSATPPWPYIDGTLPPPVEEGRKVKDKYVDKDPKREPPDGPILYQDSTIAGEDVSGRISSSPPTDAAEGQCIWVQLMDGSFKFAARLFGNRADDTPPFPHPMLSKGENVQSAGECVVEDGKITEVNRNSGHYQPSPKSLEKAAEDMKAQGLASSSLTVDSVVR
jgi:hypothetical protein